MRDINELIGIFKGINYDEVINEREILRLQEWVDHNRNLVCDPAHARLLQLVNEAISDRVLTNEEQREILSYCERLELGPSTENNRLHELNGIVDGIICDGVVNEAEIRRLKDWMDQNQAYIRGDQKAANLCDAIDKILSDGVVTAEEQDEIRELLTRRIDDTRFEARLEQLKKKVRDRQNIGIDLIDVLANEEAIDRIHSKAEQALGRTLSSYTGCKASDAEIIFISLVLIAMMHYDGNYYDYVQDTYEHLYARYSDQKVEGCIRAIIRRYRDSDDEANAATRVISTVLANAIVPGSYLSNFFEFIFDIYRLNLNYTLSDDLYEDFRFVYDGLRNDMLTDSDELSLNVTKKSYELIRSTKRLIVDEQQVDSVIKLSIIVVRLIDKKYWDKDIAIYNPYLKQGYKEWEKKLGKSSHSGSGERQKSDIRSRWEPKFILEGNTVYIDPPAHRIQATYDYRSISIVVENNGREMQRIDDPYISPIIGGYQINGLKIVLRWPLGKISYRVMAGDTEIYCSKDRLYRNYIVFDSNGNEIKNFSDYEGTAVFCTASELARIAPYYRDRKYMLSACTVHVGDTLVVDGQLFSFSSFVKPGVYGELHEKCYLRKADADRLISVYRTVTSLDFECEDSDVLYTITLDGREQRLRDMRVATSRSNGKVRYSVDLSGVGDGIHSIAVNSMALGTRSVVVREDFVVDFSLTTQCDHIDAATYQISVRSSLFDQVQMDISASEYDENWLTLIHNGETYTYVLPFEFEFYRVTGDMWQPNSGDLWIGDITQDSILSLADPAIDHLKIIADTGETLYDTDLNSSMGRPSVRIGFLASYKTAHEHVIILLVHSGKIKSAIYCYNKCILDEKATEVRFNPVDKSLCVVPSYHGRGNVFVVVKKSDGEVEYKSPYLQDKEELYIPGLDSFTNYEVGFYEKERGLSLKKERCLYKRKERFYAWSDFVGRSFKINTVTYDQRTFRGWIRRQHYFNWIYVRITEMVSEDQFYGEIYSRNRNKTYMMNNLNPVLIEICGDIVDDMVELAITKDGDGLLLDTEQHTIMNTLDCKNAPDIFSYEMDMNGQVSV